MADSDITFTKRHRIHNQSGNKTVATVLSENSKFGLSGRMSQPSNLCRSKEPGNDRPFIGELEGPAESGGLVRYIFPKTENAYKIW